MPKYPKGGKDNKPTGNSASSSSPVLTSGKVGRASKKQASGSSSQLKTATTTRLPPSVNPDDVGGDEKDTHGNDSPDGVPLSVDAIEEDDAPSVGEQDGAADELELDDANTVNHGQPDEEEDEEDEEVQQ